MPELPEVEVIRQGLAPMLAGRRIEAIAWSNRRLRLAMPRAALKNWIKGGKVLAVERRAKYLVIRLDNGASLIFHLGMTGRLGLFPGGTQPARHDHLRLGLDDGRELRFNDTRRFGAVQVCAPGENPETTIFSGFGPEPLGKKFSARQLADQARNRQQPVKTFLMGGRVVVGIGNIYASEILFAAKIHPAAPASSLSPAQWAAIARTTRKVLKAAIASGGTTIADYVNARGESGYFQLKLSVYGRQGQPCRRCGATIQKTVLAGRATCFCPRCQFRPSS